MKNKYYEWLCRFVEMIPNNHSKLLAFLHETGFKYYIPMDENRAEDGIYLRYRFSKKTFMEEPCSMLEFLVALSIRCENVMENPYSDDRTSMWFWMMIENLGLIDQDDDHFDPDEVNYILDRFNNREIGLFNINDKEIDIQKDEIWYQMCIWLDELIERG